MLIVLINLSPPIFSRETKYDCSFISQTKNALKYKPELRAKNNIAQNNIHFLTAGVGRASSIRGIEEKSASCVYNKYKTEVIRDGGDVMVYEGQYELGKKLLNMLASIIHH